MRFLVALVLLLVAPTLSRAALITFEWEGTINQQIGFPPELVGQAITGTYTLDDGGGPIVQEITADFDGNHFTVALADPSGSSFSSSDAPSGDSYFVGLAPGAGTFNGIAIETGAVIFGFGGDLVPSAAIGAVPTPSAANPLIGTFQILGEEVQPAVGALITSVRLAGGDAAVPEPISTLLFAAGGLIVGGAVRRRLDSTGA